MEMLLQDIEIFLLYLINCDELDKDTVIDTSQKLLNSLIFSKQNN